MTFELNPFLISHLIHTRCDQIVLDFGEIHLIKIFVSLSFDLIKGHLKCKKHAVMLGCLCKALLREEGVTHLQNGET